jgi:hypothetical protein
MVATNEVRSILGGWGWRQLIKVTFSSFVLWILAFSICYAFRQEHESFLLPFYPIEAYMYLLDYLSIGNPQIIANIIEWLESEQSKTILGLLSIVAGFFIGTCYKGGVLKFGAGAYWAWVFLIVAFVGLGYWTFLWILAGLLLTLIFGMAVWKVRKPDRRTYYPIENSGFVEPKRAVDFWLYGVVYFLKVPFELFSWFNGTLHDAFYEVGLRQQEKDRQRKQEN